MAWDSAVFCGSCGSVDQMNEHPGRLNVGKGGSCFITVTLLLCMYHHLSIINIQPHNTTYIHIYIYI